MNNFNLNAIKLDEIKLTEFSMIENFIKKSGLIFEDFLMGTQNSLTKLKYELQRNKSKIYFISQNNKIIAYIVIIAKKRTIPNLSYDWHIAYLYVDPEFRRQKLADALLNHTIHFCKNTKAVELSLYALDDNIAAINLYKNKGFEQSNFISNYLCFKLKLNDFRF